jgi:hypothetical protein
MNTNSRGHSIFARYELTDWLAIAGICLAIILWASHSSGSVQEGPVQDQPSHAEPIGR